MNFSNELLFFFSALGVFNAVLISTYFFFFKKPKDASNYFLGFLLLMFAIRVGKSVVYYFDENLAETFIKIGLGACILLGPALYFYTLSVLRPEKTGRRWLVHFGALLAVQISIGIAFPETHDPWLGISFWVPIIYYLWMGYILATLFSLKQQIIRLLSSTEKISGLDFWLLSLATGSLIIWIAYRSAAYTSYIVGALSFSFILYVFILLLFFNRKKKAIFSPREKYANKKIEASEASEMLAHLNLAMTSGALHKNASLKLSDVAQKLNILPHTLSQLLNDNLDKNFTNYINEYRIEEAKNMILTENQLTLEAIGQECGFNSKSTFYAAFKKVTGTTPAKFKKNS